MEKSLLLGEGQPGSVYKPLSDEKELTTGTRHAIPMKAIVERSMMKKTTHRVRFPASSTYSLWSGTMVGYGRTYTISSLQVTRSGTLLNLREEWGKGWS